jgi:histidinol phosphatase-like enzyme
MSLSERIQAVMMESQEKYNVVILCHVVIAENHRARSCTSRKAMPNLELRLP